MEYDGEPSYAGLRGLRRWPCRPSRSSTTATDVRLDLRGDSTVVSREVRVERLQTGGEAVVGAGLAAGERIVTSGVHRLREGEKVAPLPGVTKTNVGGLL